MKRNENVTALLTDVQRFCMHDGPGIRTVVFFKGCPLHCRWCHNPETQKFQPQLAFNSLKCVSCGACAGVCPAGAQIFSPHRAVDFSRCIVCGKCVGICPANTLEVYGKRESVGEIVETVLKDASFYGQNGGLTVSGGEPTAQPEALLSLLAAAKAAGISTAIETCGSFGEHLTDDLCSLVDLFLFDVKDTDAARLKENTGADLSGILKNLHRIDDAGGKTVLRCILIPDVNLNNLHAEKIAMLYWELKNCLYVELLPYHPFGTSKSTRIGDKEPTVFRIPEKEEILSFAGKLRAESVPVKYNGSLLP